MDYEFRVNGKVLKHTTLMGEIYKLNCLGCDIKCEVFKNDITVEIWNTHKMALQVIYKYDFLKMDILIKRKQSQFLLDHIDFFITNNAIKQTIQLFYEIQNKKNEH